MRLDALSLASVTPLLLLAPAAAQDDWSQAELERVTREIEGQVSELRGHEFVRPTVVRLADRATFLDYALARTAEHAPPEKQAADEALAKHLGLIPADMDLMQTTLALLQSQVGGFYSPGDDTFYLMEGFSGGLARVILAHELTHALDDQLFDLDAPLDRLAGSSDAQLAYHSVIEGSGTNVMNRWTMRNMHLLAPEDLLASSQMGAEELGSAPPYLWKPLMAAYLRGEAFLLAGYKLRKKLPRDGGAKPTVNDAIDLAFAAPPRSTEQVLHPAKYWSESERDEPSSVTHALGELPAGWRVAATDTLGELALAMFTTPEDERSGLDVTNPAAVMTVQYTNAAADGWDGDQAVLLRRDGASVLHLATAWDDAGEAQAFRDVIRPRIDALAARQAELVGAGAPSGWSILAYTDERLLSILVWAGCTPEELATLTAGPLQWEVEWR